MKCLQKYLSRNKLEDIPQFSEVKLKVNNISEQEVWNKLSREPKYQQQKYIVFVNRYLCFNLIFLDFLKKNKVDFVDRLEYTNIDIVVICFI